METRAEREKRTSGALEKSRQAIGQADVQSRNTRRSCARPGLRSFGAGSSASSNGTPSGKPLWPRLATWLSSASRPHRMLCISRASMPAGRSRLPPASWRLRFWPRFFPRRLRRIRGENPHSMPERGAFRGPAVRTGGAAACPGRQQLFVFAARKALGRGRRAHGRAGNQL